MKTSLFLFATVLFTTHLFAQEQRPGTANDREGLVMFVESIPATQYRHLGTVECATFSPSKFDLLLDHMIKQTKKAYPDIEYDALIFRPGKGLCKADVIQYYRDPKAKKKKPKKGEEEAINPEYKKSLAYEKDGISLFIENSPSGEYNLLGKVEIPATFTSDNVEELIQEMMRVAAETYPDHNGIVFVSGTDLRKANVIKFQ